MVNQAIFRSEAGSNRGLDVTLAFDWSPGDISRENRQITAGVRYNGVAALKHPNVVTLYSVEESDGVHFLTMELIEGQPLDRLIPANGLQSRLETARALRWRPACP
jgi:serine/threonine protein kinase